MFFDVSGTSVEVCGASVLEDLSGEIEVSREEYAAVVWLQHISAAKEKALTGCEHTTLSSL